MQLLTFVSHRMLTSSIGSRPDIHHERLVLLDLTSLVKHSVFFKPKNCFYEIGERRWFVEKYDMSLEYEFYIVNVKLW